MIKNIYLNEMINYGGGQVDTINTDFLAFMGFKEEFDEEEDFNWFNNYFEQINKLGNEIDEYIENLPDESQEEAKRAYNDVRNELQYGDNDYNNDIHYMICAFNLIKNIYEL